MIMFPSLLAPSAAQDSVPVSGHRPLFVPWRREVGWAEPFGSTALAPYTADNRAARYAVQPVS